MDPLAGNLDRQVLDGPGYLLCGAERCITCAMATVFSCRCCLRLVTARSPNLQCQLKGGRSNKSLQRSLKVSTARSWVTCLSSTSLAHRLPSFEKTITTQHAVFDKRLANEREK